MMLKVYLKALIIFYIFGNVLAEECNTKLLHKNSEFSPKLMKAECKNYSSLEDVVYACKKFIKMDYAISIFKITKTKMSLIDYFINPFDNDNNNREKNIHTLILNDCEIKKINNGAFEDLKYLRELNLAYNQLEYLDFIPSLGDTIMILNLTNNRIAHIDFNLFTHNYITLDLSYNRIEFVDFANRWNSISLNFLNLSNNFIKKVQFHPISVINQLILNLAYNPIEAFVIKDNDTESFQYQKFTINELDLTGSLNLLPTFPDRQLITVQKIVLSNNKDLFLDKLFKFIGIDQLYEMDCINCSFKGMLDEVFSKSNSYNYLNFSKSSFTNYSCEHPIFSKSIITSLDLSNQGLENLDLIFNKTSIENLNLAHNKLRNLNKNVKDLKWLDLSYSPLTILYNNSFGSQEKLYFLNVSYCNITKIDKLAFKNFVELITLDLSNNLLSIINEDIFLPLTKIQTINLSNNCLVNLQSFDFYSIPVKNVYLSGNNLKIIEKTSFYDLNNLEELIISNNTVNLTIENNAFSHLPVLKKLEIKNSKLQKFGINMLIEVPVQVLDITDNELEEINFSIHSEKSMKLETLLITYKGSLKKKTFTKLFELKYLYLVNSVIENLENCTFQALYNLLSLQFSNTVIKNADTRAFCGLFSLVKLDTSLFNNGKLLKSNIFNDLKNVLNLDLSNLNIQDLKPLTFDGLTNVEKLNLSYNSLESLRKSTFLGLNKVIELNLNNNNIRSIDIGAFESLPTLENLFLSSNNLTKLKIGTFSNLFALKYLDLANNSLTTLEMHIFLPLNSLTQLMLESNYLKTIDHLSFVANMRLLTDITIQNNKWQCNYLAEMIVTFKKSKINYHRSYFHESLYVENIDGIECVDICKFILCSEDTQWSQWN